MVCEYGSLVALHVNRTVKTKVNNFIPKIGLTFTFARLFIWGVGSFSSQVGSRVNLHVLHFPLVQFVFRIDLPKFFLTFFHVSPRLCVPPQSRSPRKLSKSSGLPWLVTGCLLAWWTVEALLLWSTISLSFVSCFSSSSVPETECH